VARSEFCECVVLGVRLPGWSASAAPGEILRDEVLHITLVLGGVL